MDLTSLVVFVCVLNTITIVAIVAWLDRVEKKDDEGYYYEDYIDDDDEDEDDEGLSGYKWDD